MFRLWQPGELRAPRLLVCILKYWMIHQLESSDLLVGAIRLKLQHASLLSAAWQTGVWFCFFGVRSGG